MRLQRHSPRVVSEKFSKKSGHGISEGGDKTNP
jgi:hypothetical protein